MPSRPSPDTRYRPGDNLVRTADGWTEYAKDTAIEQYGPRKGARVRIDELDEPGFSDIPALQLQEIVPEVITDTESKPKQTYNSSGIPLDSNGDPYY